MIYDSYEKIIKELELDISFRQQIYQIMKEKNNVNKLYLKGLIDGQNDLLDVLKGFFKGDYGYITVASDKPLRYLYKIDSILNFKEFIIATEESLKDMNLELEVRYSNADCLQSNNIVITDFDEFILKTKEELLCS